MWWVYAGYFAAYYLASAAYFVISLPTHRDPHQLAVFSFGVVPVLVICPSAEPIALIPAEERRSVHAAFKEGRLSRRLSFGLGLGAGLVGVAGVLGSWHGLHYLGAPSWVCLLAIPAIIVVGACLGGGCVLALAHADRTGSDT